MIYLLATFVALSVMSLGLFVVLKKGKGKVGSCSAIANNKGGGEVYCGNCNTMVKDKCLKS